MIHVIASRIGDNMSIVTHLYSVNSVNLMIETLESWIIQTIEEIESPETRDYIDRLETLRNRVDSLSFAKSSLEEIR